jgi:tetratricopeptide (TPR) repeat protein
MHHFKLSPWLGAIALIACTGCVSNPPAAPTGEQGLAALLVKANGAEAAGQKEQAVNLWKQATTAYPAAKEPWAKLAQFQYDAGQYADAALSAQQVLTRDSADDHAHELMTRASLKLAALSAGELARQKDVSAMLRADTQDSMRQLREALAEPRQEVAPPSTARAPGSNKHPERKPPKTAGPFDKLKDYLR